MAIESEYEVLSWNQIYDMLQVQAQKIQSCHYKPDIIVGVARGGLVPARILMDLLETRDFAIIQIEYYQGINQPGTQPILKQCLNTDLSGKKALLVDDVSDGGNSLQLAKKHLQEKGAEEVKIATLYIKPQTITLSDYFGKKTNCWIVFPWEIKETIRKIQEQYKGERAINQEIIKLEKAGLPKQIVEKYLKGTL
jgi:hypoxanthine phosphoribosyltransferase